MTGATVSVAPRAGRGVLSVDEGAALRVLHVLLGAERGLPRTGVALARVGPQFATVIKQRLALAATRFLLDNGGRAERTVLRGGRRVTGRLWDLELNTGFGLAFTSASLQLVVEAAHTLPSLVGRQAAEAAAREATARAEKRRSRELVAIESTATGDWIFYAIVHERLGALDLPDQTRRTLKRRLHLGSPLAMLLDPSEESEPLAAGMRRLVAPANVRLLECTDALLARAWGAFADDAWNDRSRRAAVATARWSALRKVLQAYLGAIGAARRMDLARPVMRFVTHLATRTFAKGGAEVRKLASAWYDLRDIRERDELIAAIAAVVGTAAEMLRTRDELATMRYGDDQYEESQLYLRVVAEELAPARRAIEDVARGLSGAVG